MVLLQPTVDKSVQRVQNKLASMLDRLEIEIQSVEKRIGDKLHILDRDKVSHEAQERLRIARSFTRSGSCGGIARMARHTPDAAGRYD